MGATFSTDLVSVTEFDYADTELPARTVERTSLLLQVSDPIDVELSFEGRFEKQHFRPGDFCIVPAGPAPAARWRGQRSVVEVQLSQRLLEAVAETHNMRSVDLPCRAAVEDPRITHLLRALHAETTSEQTFGNAYVDAISRAVAIRLLTAHGVAPAETPKRGGLARAVLRRVQDHIESNLDQPLTLQSLASVSGLSADHFARAFRDSTGEPPHQYILRRRIERARELVEHSRLSIAEVAQLAGFADQSHLTNVFRRRFGATPGRLRSTALAS